MVKGDTAGLVKGRLHIMSLQGLYNNVDNGLSPIPDTQTLFPSQARRAEW